MSAVKPAAASELLMSAASMLCVGVAAFTEGGELNNGASLTDVLVIVQTAQERVESWLDKHFDGPPGAPYPDEAFDAWDILTVLQAALAAGLNPSGRGRTVNPIRGAMHAAAELLERAVDAEQQAPDPESGNEADETADGIAAAA